MTAVDHHFQCRVVMTTVDRHFLFNRYNSVDVNVAVATDAGLITPIVSRADIKVGHLEQISIKWSGIQTLNYLIKL